MHGLNTTTLLQLGALLDQSDSVIGESISSLVEDKNALATALDALCVFHDQAKLRNRNGDSGDIQRLFGIVTCVGVHRIAAMILDEINKREAEQCESDNT